MYGETGGAFFALFRIMPGPIIKPFYSMKVKTYWLYYPHFRYGNVFDKFLPEMVYVCPHRVKFVNALS